MKSRASRKRPAAPNRKGASNNSGVLLKAPSPRQKAIFGACILLASCFLLFWNLGGYALWDDEAETALGAKGVLATGDTTAVIGHNIQARRGGVNLINLHDRTTPPLPTYLMAGSFRALGISSFAARLPSALCGLLAIALILWWLWKSEASIQTWLLVTTAIIGNVSLFLYFRQARYYGNALFLAILLGYLYLNWKPTWRHALFLSLTAGALFMCQPICLAQAGAAIALDYFLFNRQLKIFQLRTFPFLFIPAALIVIGTLLVWNPLATKAGAYLKAVTLGDRVTLLYWYFRDINASEFLVGGLALAAPIAYAVSKNRWILRCLAAIVTVVVVTSIVTYQNVKQTSVADIRYAIAVIPLGIALGVFTIQGLVPRNTGWAVVIAVLAFWTNLLHGSIFQTVPVRSTVKQFAGELIHPIAEPYTPVAAWIRENTSPESSVLVLPDYMAYPLMFHAPQAIYAWQIPDRSDPQYSGLPAIHFKGEVMPDYIVVFGPTIKDIMPDLREWANKGIRYELAANIPVFWQDLYRPELFWRSFVSITRFNPELEGVTILKRQN